MRSFVPATTSSLEAKRGRNFSNQLAMSCSASNRLSAWRGGGGNSWDISCLGWSSCRSLPHRSQQGQPRTAGQQLIFVYKHSLFGLHVVCTYRNICLYIENTWIRRWQRWLGLRTGNWKYIKFAGENFQGFLFVTSSLKQIYCGDRARGLHSIPAAKT